VSINLSIPQSEGDEPPIDAIESVANQNPALQRGILKSSNFTDKADKRMGNTGSEANHSNLSKNYKQSLNSNSMPLDNNLSLIPMFHSRKNLPSVEEAPKQVSI
jgi:hypothetical protein